MPKFDPRVQIHVNWGPNLEYYPNGVTSKKEAMEFDVQSLHNGALGLADLLEFADDVTVTVVEVKVPE